MWGGVGGSYLQGRHRRRQRQALTSQQRDTVWGVFIPVSRGGGNGGRLCRHSETCYVASRLPDPRLRLVYLFLPTPLERHAPVNALRPRCIAPFSPAPVSLLPSPPLQVEGLQRQIQQVEASQHSRAARFGGQVR